MVHTLFKSLFIFIFLSGCATIPRLSKELDTAAKTFETTTDKANIYIVRDEFIGAAVGMPLDINGKLLGKTSALTYILATVTPGTQNIISHAENDSTLSLDVEPGKNYFVWQEVKMGLFMARTKLHSISETEGKAKVLKCERVGLPQ